MAQEAWSQETALEKQKEKLRAKLEEFRLIAAQAMKTCESIEKELRGENN